jgi:hypothetical protein
MPHKILSMLNGTNKNHSNHTNSFIANEGEINFDGYPIYPPEDDIYERFHEERNIDPEDTSKKKLNSNTKKGEPNELDFDETLIGDDLDIPGADLDDMQESVGSEDEENNYYSIGGDNHEDLEEDRS